VSELDEKEIYTQTVQTYLFFLNWRAKLLAGYFASPAVLAYAFVWICEHNLDNVLCVVPLVGFILTVFFNRIECRNLEQMVSPSPGYPIKATEARVGRARFFLREVCKVARLPSALKPVASLALISRPLAGGK
jgi:hypothetical protein